MKIHPNVVTISEMMTRLRGLVPMDKEDARSLRKAGWTVGKPATYATCSMGMKNGNRLEATVTTKGMLYLDVHNDGPTYGIARGQHEDYHIVSAAISAASMMLDIHHDRAVATLHQGYMLPTDEAAA